MGHSCKSTVLSASMFLMGSLQNYSVKKHEASWENIMKGLGEVAFKKLLEEKDGSLLFDEKYLAKFLVPEIGCKTGIVLEVGFNDAVSELCGTSRLLTCAAAVKWYQFVHKSLQEFCAAFYLSNLTETKSKEALEELKSFIYRYQAANSLFVFRLFLSGLTNESENNSSFELLSLIEAFLLEEEVGWNEKNRDHENQLDCWLESCDSGGCGITLFKGF